MDCAVRTDTAFGTQIGAREDFDAEVLLDFADDFDGVGVLEMAILSSEHAGAAGSAFGRHQHCLCQADVPWAMAGIYYLVEMQRDGAVGVDGCLFAADLAHFAYDADGAVGELLQVGGGDARG